MRFFETEPQAKTLMLILINKLYRFFCIKSTCFILIIMCRGQSFGVKPDMRGVFKRLPWRARLNGGLWNTRRMFTQLGYIVFPFYFNLKSMIQLVVKVI